MASQTFQEAQERDFQGMRIFLAGNRVIDGHFANIRIDRRTVPEGWHVYDIRDEDSNGEPCQIHNGYVMVNHFGTFATQEDLGIANGDSFYIADSRGDIEENEFRYSFT